MTTAPRHALSFDFSPQQVVGVGNVSVLKEIVGETDANSIVEEARRLWESKLGPTVEDLSHHDLVVANNILREGLEELRPMKALSGNKARFARILVLTHVQTLAVGR